MAELIDIISQNTQSTVVAEYERENQNSWLTSENNWNG